MTFTGGQLTLCKKFVNQGVGGGGSFHVHAASSYVSMMIRIVVLLPACVSRGNVTRSETQPVMTTSGDSQGMPRVLQYYHDKQGDLWVLLDIGLSVSVLLSTGPMRGAGDCSGAELLIDTARKRVPAARRVMSLPGRVLAGSHWGDRPCLPLPEVVPEMTSFRRALSVLMLTLAIALPASAEGEKKLEVEATLVVLVASDELFLNATGSLQHVRGVVALSGLYRIPESRKAIFGDESSRKAVSAINLARAGLPPVFLAWADKDSPDRDRESREYADALKNVKVAVVSYEARDRDHGTLFTAIKNAEDPTVAEILRFIDIHGRAARGVRPGSEVWIAFWLGPTPGVACSRGSLAARLLAPFAARKAHDAWQGFQPDCSY